MSETSSLKPAAAYIRVSTEDQLEYSPESQLKMIRDYAQRSGFFIPEEYIFMDEGISGRRAERRPAFMRMIAVAKTKPKPFNAILLWKFSRFARNRQDSIVYKSMLRKQLGIEVLSVSEFLGDDKISVLVEAIIEAMDEYYSVNLAEEVRRGMTEKARRGEPLSIAPFGYRLENKRLVVVPKEAGVIQSVFEQYVRGKSLSHISKTLNSMGVITHRGGKIETRTIEYWLHNPVYIGKIRWTPTGKINRDFHNPDSMIVDGGHESIIGIELWQSVQNLLVSSSPRRHASQKDLSHWLVGFARCGLCGGAMVNCRGYFYCGKKSKGGCIGMKGIRIQTVAEKLIMLLKDFTQGLSPAYIIPGTGEHSGCSGKDMLSSALCRLSRVKEAYEAGIDTLDEYRINKAKITAEIEIIKRDLIFSSPDSAVSVPTVCLSDLFIGDDFSNEIKNAVLRTVVRHVILFADKISVSLYI